MRGPRARLIRLGSIVAVVAILAGACGTSDEGAARDQSAAGEEDAAGAATTTSTTTSSSSTTTSSTTSPSTTITTVPTTATTATPATTVAPTTLPAQHAATTAPTAPPTTAPTQCAPPSAIQVDGGNPGTLPGSGGNTTVASLPVVISTPPLIQCGGGHHYKLSYSSVVTNADGSSTTYRGGFCSPNGSFREDISARTAVGAPLTVTLELPPNDCG